MVRGTLILTLAAALAVFSLTASADAASPKVRIWQPTAAPDVPARLDAPYDRESAGPVEVNVKVVLLLPAYDYRAEAYERALGQRYLGFYRQYSGPRYPF
jgi:hypothetical protein